MALEAAPKSAVLDFLGSHNEYVTPVVLSGPYAALVEDYQTDHPVVTEIDRESNIIARAAKVYDIRNPYLVNRLYSLFHYYEPAPGEHNGRTAYTDAAQIHVKSHGNHRNVVNVKPLATTR